MSRSPAHSMLEERIARNPEAQFVRDQVCAKFHPIVEILRLVSGSRLEANFLHRACEEEVHISAALGCHFCALLSTVTGRGGVGKSFSLDTVWDADQILKATVSTDEIVRLLSDPESISLSSDESRICVSILVLRRLTSSVPEDDSSVPGDESSLLEDESPLSEDESSSYKQGSSLSENEW